MAAKWIEALTGPLEQKKQYKQAIARIDALPEPHRTAAKALTRYFMYYGGITDGDLLVTMIADHADLWERTSLDGTPVRAIVGDDPVEFAESFASSYSGTQWIDKERTRLTTTIDEALTKAETEHTEPTRPTTETEA
jgi:DNA-binding ferritin-like protein (Dps family)